MDDALTAAGGYFSAAVSAGSAYLEAKVDNWQWALNAGVALAEASLTAAEQTAADAKKEAITARLEVEKWVRWRDMEPYEQSQHTHLTDEQLDDMIVAETQRIQELSSVGGLDHNAP